VKTKRTLHRLGDRALVAEVDGYREAHRLASAVQGASWEGVEDVVVGYESVTVLVDPSVVDPEALAPELGALPLARAAERSRKRVEVPVSFDGPDLEEVARLAGCGAGDVVEAMLEAKLEAAFIGFAPGFAYLVGLPRALAQVPRRSTPRRAVEAGSVALGGGFASIYPQRSPGGWQIVGRTSLRMFHPDAPPFALVQPGDEVRFVAAAVGTEVHDSRAASPSSPASPPAPPRSDALSVRVERPGMLSLVEDAGRIGFGGIGVPRAGGADPFSLLLSNRLVGNDDGAAVIEATGAGPTLKVGGGAHAAVVGDVEVRVEGRTVPPNSVLPLAAGQVLEVGTVRKGLRAYVAFSGGIEVPQVLGSRSTDTLSGLGGGPLRLGDVVALRAPRRPRGRLGGPPWWIGREVLRVVLGPEELEQDQLARLVGTTFEVVADSDRVGVRLLGGPVHPQARAIASRATVTGAVQVPPDGAPIVLLCDHATVGGYPVVASVISADLGALGQLRPGARLRFEVVSHADARNALAEVERALHAQVTGWYPSRTG